VSLEKYDVYRYPEYESYLKHLWTCYWPNDVHLFDKVRHIYAGAHGSHSFKDRSVESIIEEIKDCYQLGIRVFFFDITSEGVMVEGIEKIATIANQVTELNVELVYWSGDYTAETHINEYFSTQDIQLNFTVLGCSHLEWMGASYPNYNKEYQPGPKLKKFLCFNKVHRQHRIDLLEYVINNIPLEETYYSFDCDDEFHLELITSHEDYPGIKSIKDRIPLVLNKTAERSNPVNIIEDDHQYFENSYFSVVTETLFHHYPVDSKPGLQLQIPNTLPGRFVSEKTFKCVAMKHPFIVLGPYKMLDFLKSRGYQTFAPYIDESYDNIENDDERLLAVCKEVKRLSELPADQLIQFTEFAKPIVEYNEQVMRSVTNFTTINNLADFFV
jgi:hypothetical protein